MIAILEKSTEQSDIWKTCENNEQILKAPNVVFGETKDEIKSKILLQYPNRDTVACQFPLLFNQQIRSNRYSSGIVTFEVQKNTNNEIQINPNDIIYDPHIRENFIRYIKSYGPYNYSDHNSEKDRYGRNYGWPRFSNPSVKQILNAHEIYVRSTKKILEYNPKLALKQRQRIKKSKPQEDFLRSNQIQRCIHSLEHLLVTQANLDIRRPYRFSKTKFDFSSYLTLLVNIAQKAIIPSHGYRHIDSFQQLVSQWKVTSGYRRNAFPENFRQLMATELKGKKPRQTKCVANKKFLNVFYVEKK
jgi:hypothetical protein